MRAEEIKRVYDKRATTYDRTVGFGERLLVGDLRRRFGALLEGETLEVAIGSGLNLPYYTDAVTRAVGLDLSPGMLAEARARADDLGMEIELIEGDAEAIPFPVDTFDSVGISLALCTVPEPERALRELVRVCRPGGRVVLLEHVRAASPLISLPQRALSPLQERLIGCHLDRPTLDTARALGLEVEVVASRLAGVFRLAVVRV